MASSSYEEPKIYFSEYFNVARSDIETYGAIDISLIADLPLFVDPFLIFESDKPEYQALHEEIIEYLRFLKSVALEASNNAGLRKSLFYFKEVEQNWLGFSRSSNKGAGLGEKFSVSLSGGLGKVLDSLGDESVTTGAHLEKLCLLGIGIGKDRISDFTVNLIKRYLLEYTEKFALEYIDKVLLSQMSVDRVEFDYGTRRWKPRIFTLPYHKDNKDYVLLIPVDILTKDDTWINKESFHSSLLYLPNAVENEQLREEINAYIRKQLPDDPSAKETEQAYLKAVTEYPVLMDVYIKKKEDKGEVAVRRSATRVEYVEDIFLDNAKSAIRSLGQQTDFYSGRFLADNSFQEVLRRVGILKRFIEENDGYRCFYNKSGKRVHNEDELQRLFKLIWWAHGSIYDINPETNHGRGPADFTVSLGSKDKTYVEFKLASNTSLEKNLLKQVETYQNADIATLESKSVKVILYFKQEELASANGILTSLGINKSPGIVMIDARNDNKPSGSKA